MTLQSDLVKISMPVHIPPTMPACNGRATAKIDRAAITTDAPGDFTPFMTLKTKLINFVLPTALLCLTALIAQPAFGLEPHAEFPVDLALQDDGVQARVFADGMRFHLGRNAGAGPAAFVYMRVGTFTSGPQPVRNVSLQDHQHRPHSASMHVTVPDVLPGVDMLAYVDAGLPRYDFVLEPGANPDEIVLAFSGIDSLQARQTDLALFGGDYVFTHRELFAYQEIGGQRVQVDCGFRDLGSADNEFLLGFELGAYDATLPLVIDPLVDATYWGGGHEDEITDVRRRADGSLIVVGMTRSADFPQTPGSTTANDDNDPDIFVSAFSENGTELLWSRQFGGNAADLASGMDVTPDGRILICGQTSSMDFEVVESTLQTERRGSTDGFVIMLTADGAAIEYATFLGGVSDDTMSDVAWHAQSRSIILCGWSASEDFPVVGVEPYQDELKVGASGTEVRDAVVLRLDHLDDVILYSTFLGGTGSDAAIGIDVDAEGDAYICGWSDSRELREAENANSGERDAFAARFGINGALRYLRFLGGEFDDEAADIRLVDGALAAIVGSTNSPDFERSATALQSELKGGPIFSDGFLTVLGSNGGIEYSTFVGGELNDGLEAVDVREGRFIAMAGATESAEFSFAVEGCSGARGISDVFAAVFDLTGDELLFAGQYGGVQDDRALAAAWRNDTRFFLAGSTESRDFPVGASALQAMMPWDDELKIAENAFVGQMNIEQSQEYRISGSLDFGFVPQDLSKSVTLTIHNLRSSPLTLNISEGDKFGDMQLQWTGEVTIEPCGSYEITVTLTPQSRRRHGIEILITSAESERTFRFQAGSRSQEDSAADVVLRIPRNLTAAPGAEFNVPLLLESANFDLNPDSRPVRMTCAISFNARSFTPVDPAQRGILQDDRHVIFQDLTFGPGEFEPGTVLAEIPMIAGLGDNRETLISIDDVTWFDASTAELTTLAASIEQGLFTTDDLWEFPDGRTRLAQPAEQELFMEILPNVISDGRLRIRALHPQDASLRLIVSNLSGDELLDLSAELNLNGGESQITRDINSLGSGLLFVRLISGTNTLARLVLLE